jgi:predicted short-subunit dehydrogenase-like oxidoreductase (DUF2520 family)
VTPPSRPLAGLSFALVGAGAVGSALGAWLARRGARCAAIAARPGSPRAFALAAALGAEAVDLERLDSSLADLLLLAAPDAELAAVAGELARRPQAAVALHVAGALPSTAIGALRAAGSATGVFHPLRAFAGAADPEPPPALFFALGGEPRAIALGRRLAEGLGASSAEIDDAARPLYHLVATLLAGGITTVAATAFEIRRRAGLPAEADAGYASLAKAALSGALAGSDPAAGITGPAARGDLETFRLEARALRRVAPEALAVVLALGGESLRQRARVTPANAAQKRLAEALESPELLDLAKDRVLTSDPDPSG